MLPPSAPALASMDLYAPTILHDPSHSPNRPRSRRSSLVANARPACVLRGCDGTASACEDDENMLSCGVCGERWQSAWWFAFLNRPAGEDGGEDGDMAETEANWAAAAPRSPKAKGKKKAGGREDGTNGGGPAEGERARQTAVVEASEEAAEEAATAQAAAADKAAKKAARKEAKAAAIAAAKEAAEAAAAEEVAKEEAAAADKAAKAQARRERRELYDDCGECLNCLDKPKFAGANVRRRACSEPKLKEGAQAPAGEEAEEAAGASPSPKNAAAASPQKRSRPAAEGAPSAAPLLLRVGERIEVEVAAEDVDAEGDTVWVLAEVVQLLEGRRFVVVVNGDVDFVEEYGPEDEGDEWRRRGRGATEADEIAAPKKMQKAHAGAVAEADEVGQEAEAATVEDCGTCSHCLDKKKFGGPGTKKQKCKDPLPKGTRVAAPQPPPRKPSKAVVASSSSAKASSLSAKVKATGCDGGKAASSRDGLAADAARLSDPRALQRSSRLRPSAEGEDAVCAGGPSSGHKRPRELACLADWIQPGKSWEASA